MANGDWVRRADGEWVYQGPPRQLEMYEACDVCGGFLYGLITGRRAPEHEACGRALERWIRADNLDWLEERAKHAGWRQAL